MMMTIWCWLNSRAIAYRSCTGSDVQCQTEIQAVFTIMTECVIQQANARGLMDLEEAPSGP